MTVTDVLKLWPNVTIVFGTHSDNWPYVEVRHEYGQTDSASLFLTDSQVAEWLALAPEEQATALSEHIAEADAVFREVA